MDPSTDNLDQNAPDAELNLFQSLDVRLISPSGTVSYLVYGFDTQQFKTVAQRIADNERTQGNGDTPDTNGQTNGDDSNAGQENNGPSDSSDDDVFLLTSTHSWSEQAAGEWKILAVDKTTGASIPLDGWQLDLWGADDHVDNNYVFTDEYKQLAGADSLRQVLADQNGGQDTANFAAMTSAVKIALDGSEGTADGTPWKVDANAVIERAIGGDGNDQIAGNDASNWLRSERGDDFMTGGLGNGTLSGGDDAVRAGGGDDIIIHGFGDDLLEGGAGTDILEVNFVSSGYRLDGTAAQGSLVNIGNAESDPGTDTFTSIEMVRFTDQTLAFNGSGWLPAVG